MFFWRRGPINPITVTTGVGKQQSIAAVFGYLNPLMTVARIESSPPATVLFDPPYLPQRVTKGHCIVFNRKNASVVGKRLQSCLPCRILRQQRATCQPDRQRNQPLG